MAYLNRSTELISYIRITKKSFKPNSRIENPFISEIIFQRLTEIEKKAAADTFFKNKSSTRAPHLVPWY